MRRHLLISHILSKKIFFLLLSVIFQWVFEVWEIIAHYWQFHLRCIWSLAATWMALIDLRTSHSLDLGFVDEFLGAGKPMNFPTQVIFWRIQLHWELARLESLFTITRTRASRVECVWKWVPSSRTSELSSEKSCWKTKHKYVIL